jgi:hypothetical protein
VIDAIDYMVMIYRSNLMSIGRRVKEASWSPLP